MVTVLLHEARQNAGLFGDDVTPRTADYWLRRLREGESNLGVKGDKGEYADSAGSAPPERLKPQASKEVLFKSYRDSLENGDHESADKLHAQLKVAHPDEDEADEKELARIVNKVRGEIENRENELFPIRAANESRERPLSAHQKLRESLTWRPRSV